MIKHNQDGAANGLMISFVLAIFFLLAALGFGAWAFVGRQDYKNNSDAKAAAAAAEAVKKEDIKKDAQFAEQAKKPLRTYSGPDAYGNLHVEFPKTWSGYVIDQSTSANNAVVNGFFAPNVVSDASDNDTVFALRVQVLSSPYSVVANNYSGRQKQGKVTISAYSLPKLPKVVGIKVAGQITDAKTATMIILPLRSQTVMIWTEGDQYLNDFNNYILPNFTFVP